MQMDATDSFQGEGRVVLTASNEIEYAFEENELTSGAVILPFTREP